LITHERLPFDLRCRRLIRVPAHAPRDFAPPMLRRRFFAATLRPPPHAPFMPLFATHAAVFRHFFHALHFDAIDAFAATPAALMPRHAPTF